MVFNVDVIQGEEEFEGAGERGRIRRMGWGGEGGRMIEESEWGCIIPELDGGVLNA